MHFQSNKWPSGIFSFHALFMQMSYIFKLASLKIHHFPRTRPLATRSAPFSGTRYWYPSHSLWVLQSFCSTSPWRPLFQLALIYFLSLVAMPTLARRCLHYTCTMETNCEENHLNQHQSLQCQNTSWHETVTRHEYNREFNAEKKIISMNSNTWLLFLARLTCLIETVVDFPIQTPLEFCIVNVFTIRRPESISWLDLIKMSIREPIFSLPIQHTDKAQCPLAIYPFLFKTRSGFLAPHFSKMYVI